MSRPTDPPPGAPPRERTMDDVRAERAARPLSGGEVAELMQRPDAKRGTPQFAGQERATARWASDADPDGLFPIEVLGAALAEMQRRQGHRPSSELADACEHVAAAIALLDGIAQGKETNP